jgi:hypothetical protein
MRDFLMVTALIGATLIVTQSVLFRPIRRLWPSLLKCGQCVGTWIGVSAGFFGLLRAVDNIFLNALIVGASNSVLVMLVDGVLCLMFGEVVEEGDSDETQTQEPEK